jgi:TATA-binding protein-associated factor
MPLPSFTTLQDWELVKSTKMDVCAKICQHYLSHDDIPDMEFVDGYVMFPAIPAMQIQAPFTIECKILIYSELPSVTVLLMNIRFLLSIDDAQFLINSSI